MAVRALHQRGRRACACGAGNFARAPIAARRWAGGMSQETWLHPLSTTAALSVAQQPPTARPLSTATQFGVSNDGPWLPKVTHAFVRDLADSFATDSLRDSEPEVPIDMPLARAQHAAYVEALRSVVPHVTQLEADESLPDCVFVEDTAIAVGDRVVLCTPGHPSRRRETEATANAVRQLAPRVTVMSLKEAADAAGVASEAALLDGGDVLYTGRELLVGLSGRSTEGAVRALAHALHPLPVIGVPVVGALHLKSLGTLCAPDTLVITKSRHGDAIRAAVEAHAVHADKYTWLEVPDMAAANCVLVNGTIFHRSARECPEAVDVFSALGLPTVELDASEVEKADGALSCCSLLVAARDT